MSTCSFEDLKQYYLEIYEVIGEILIIPIILDNLYYRKDKNKINIEYFEQVFGNKNFKCLNDLVKGRNKGNRFKFINNDEKFCSILDLNVNIKLRNAIGHNDYKFDPITQIIEYLPNQSSKDAETIYLLEFAGLCLDLTKSLLILEEMIYGIEIYSYLDKGIRPTVNTNQIHSKVGRNEKCPCGSGKKYKKCHGMNN